MATKKNNTGLVPQLRFPEFEEDGEWVESTLGDEAKFYRGKGISKSDIEPNASNPVIRYGELYTTYGEVINKVLSKTNIETSDLFLSHQNDVLIPSSGETKIDIATASCVIERGVGLGGDLNVIRSTHHGPFLSYYLNGPKRFQIAKVAQGNTVIHLYSSSLKLIPIELPKPAEQQKIADCLSSLDELITAHTAKLDALQDHKKGLLQQLFPAEGETTPTLRFPEFKDSGAWKEGTVDELGKVVTGSTPKTSEPKNYGGDRLFASPADMSNSRFIEKTKTTLSELGFSKTRQIKPNSTLFVCIGSTIGKTAQNKEKCATNQQINSIMPYPKFSESFVYFLMSRFSETIAELAGRQAIPIINKTLFSSVKIPYPEFKEQQKIADCLSTVDSLIEAQTQKIESLKTHKKGLMQQLFPNSESP